MGIILSILQTNHCGKGFFALACGINPAENGKYFSGSPHDLSLDKAISPYTCLPPDKIGVRDERKFHSFSEQRAFIISSAILLKKSLPPR